jgi:phosphoglycerate kinase
MELKSVKDVDVKGKKVLLRVGFDVPLRDGAVADDTRIKESLPTIKYLMEHDARIILVFHIGRPKGKVKKEFSVAPVAQQLQVLLPDYHIRFVPHSVAENGLADSLPIPAKGEIMVLENIRFCPGEENNDEQFARQLAALADLYIDDAFSVVHRRHASVEAIAHFLPSYAGMLVEKEVQALSGLLADPKRPFIGIIGGAKISTKLNLITALIKKVDFLLLGGALANTILKAQGVQVGKSLIEEKMVAAAKKLSLTDNKLKIPVDVVAARAVAADAPIEKRAVGNVAVDQIILDIGPDTVQLYTMIIEKAKTVVWNGPMGYFEIQQFAQGTYDMARCIVGQAGIQSVVGGGETIDAINTLRLKDKFSFVSTGGGAMLEFLEGKVLPGLEPLIKKQSSCQIK